MNDPITIAKNFLAGLDGGIIGRDEITSLPTSTLRAICEALIAAGEQRVLPPPPKKKGEKLPDWEDLRGVAPNVTGSLSSEDFVRKQRDEWER